MIVVAAFALAPAAGAAQQIGMTMFPDITPGAMNCLKETAPQNNTATLIQYQRQAGSTPLYTVPAGGGVVTSWAHMPPGPIGFAEVIALQMLRPIGGTQFQVIGQSAEESVVISQLGDPVYSSFPTRIPVQAGDVLALAVAHQGNVAYCLEAAPPDNLGDKTRELDGTGDSGNNKPSPTLGSTLDFATPAAVEQSARLDVAAMIEPDRDGDGFGDETQDPDGGGGTSAPPAATSTPTLASIPAAVAPKKCKKGRKLKKGKCVKKKKK